MESYVTFSEYKPDDYEGFVACINNFYDGGYPYLPYLERDTLNKLTDSGQMIVTVAKNINGQVIGTSAAHRLDGIFEGSILLLLRCVLKEYRGKGIGTQQEYFLFDLVHKRFGEYESLYADVMTHDAISQTTLTKNGFVFCGFRMSLYKNEIICPGKNFAPGTKMTQAIYCKALHTKDVKLYVPEKLRPVAAGIYGQLNIPCSFSESDYDRADVKYQIHANQLHKDCELQIEYAGVGQIDKLIYDANKLVDDGYTCVAYINMNQSGCHEICRRLEEIGYKFSAIKPLSASGEYLVMSNIKNCVKNFQDIKYPECHSELANYIIGGFNR